VGGECSALPPLIRTLDGPQSRSRLEKRKLFARPGLKLRLLGHSARRQSLYRLSYCGSGLEAVVNGKYLVPAGTRHATVQSVESRYIYFS
jgi:hypothetical protein